MTDWAGEDGFFKIRVGTHQYKRSWSEPLPARKRSRKVYKLSADHWLQMRCQSERIQNIRLDLDPEELSDVELMHQTHEPVHVMAEQWPIYKLLDYQQRYHVIALRQMAQHHLVLLDTSETGCGKTYAAPGFAEQLAHSRDLFTTVSDHPLSMFVITIKPVVQEFQKLCYRDDFKQSVNLIGIANYDLLVKGKCWIYDVSASAPKKVKNPYLIINRKVETRDHDHTALDDKLEQLLNSVEDGIYSGISKDSKEDCSPQRGKKYVWKLPPRTLLVIDEAHRARNTDSQAFAIVSAALEQYRLNPFGKSDIRILMSTATLFEKYEAHLPVIMYFTGLISTVDFQTAQNVLRDPHIRGHLAATHHGPYPLLDSREVDIFVLHKLLFHNHYPCAHGMKLKAANEARQLQRAKTAGNPTTLTSYFNEVRSIHCRMEPKHHEAIEKSVRTLWNLMLQEQERNLTSSQMVLQGKMRQLTENYKVDTFLQLIDLVLASELSCIVLMNYKETLGQINRYLAEHRSAYNSVKIIGGQTPRERTSAIQKFQSNQSRVILVMVQAGGVGISLNDTTSVYPIVTLISPPLSATGLTQVFGRGYRSGSCSDCLQLLIFAKDTVEEKIYMNQKSKLRCQDILNYGQVNERTNMIFSDHQPIHSNLDKFSDTYRPRFDKLIGQLQSLIC